MENADILIKQAFKSLEHGKNAEFELPGEAASRNFNTYDPGIVNIDEKFLVEEGKKTIKRIKNKKSNASIGCGIGRDISEIRIANTLGVNSNHKFSKYYNYPFIQVENSGGGIYDVRVKNSYVPVEEKLIEKLISYHNYTSKVIPVPTKKMKALFTDFTVDALAWRFRAAANGNSLYQKISPLMDKEGEKIVSEKFSYYDDPLIKDYFNSREFDDEGTPARKLPIIENGVFKNFIFDLDKALKCGRESTGNGYKGGTLAPLITTLPSPAVRTNYIAPGDKTFEEMVENMDEGIILTSLLGAHSGNIMNGDFSCSVGIGYYVKNGEVIGRAGDSMVAGNVYELFNNIEAIENVVHLKGNAYPAILFNDVSLAGK